MKRIKSVQPIRSPLTTPKSHLRRAWPDQKNSKNWPIRQYCKHQ